MPSGSPSTGRTSSTFCNRRTSARFATSSPTHAPGVQATLFTGAGQAAFSAGVNIEAFVGLTQARAHALIGDLAQVMRAIRHSPVVTVAAVSASREMILTGDIYNLDHLPPGSIANLVAEPADLAAAAEDLLDRKPAVRVCAWLKRDGDVDAHAVALRARASLPLRLGMPPLVVAWPGLAASLVSAATSCVGPPGHDGREARGVVADAEWKVPAILPARGRGVCLPGC